MIHVLAVVDLFSDAQSDLSSFESRVYVHSIQRTVKYRANEAIKEPHANDELISRVYLAFIFCFALCTLHWYCLVCVFAACHCIHFLLQ